MNACMIHFKRTAVLTKMNENLLLVNKTEHLESKIMATSSNSSKFITLHKENFASSVTNALYNDSLDDSSLTCDLIIKAGPEKLEYYCHRIILASTSDFIWEVLSTATPGTVPILLLPDISSTVIQLVLFYVYNGHVEIPLPQYADFVDACQLLQLKGPIDNVQTIVKQTDVSEDISKVNISMMDPYNTEELYETDDREWRMEDEDSADGNYSVAYEDSADGNYSVAYDGSVLYSGGLSSVNGTVPVRKKKCPNRPISMMVTPELEEKFLKQAKFSVESVYKRIDQRLGDRYDAVVNNTKLSVIDGRLVSGEHICGFCDRPIKFYFYIRNEQTIKWNNTGLRVHFERHHKFQYTATQQRMLHTRLGEQPYGVGTTTHTTLYGPIGTSVQKCSGSPQNL